MPRLTNEVMSTVSKYVRLRYSHYPKTERKSLKKRLIKQLKQEPQERVDKFVDDINDLFARSGL